MMRSHWSAEVRYVHPQEVQIMQTLADIPELVRCYPYNPQPRPQSRSGLQICQLVMELMEVTPPSFCAAMYQNCRPEHVRCAHGASVHCLDNLCAQQDAMMHREGICTMRSMSGRSA